jgi:HEAT repeat protein
MQIVEQPRVYEVFGSAAAASLQEFRRQFQAVHSQTPLRAVKLFLYYLGTRGLDPVSESMAFWSTSGTTYISVLLATGPLLAESLSPEIAANAIALLPRLDPQFLFKFARSAAALREVEEILHALRLAPALGDYSILIPWLRALIQSSNLRLRSRAAKLLCQLRPNKGLIDRHLHSSDPRIRAAVMEALWQPKVLDTTEDVLPFFRTALTDSNHRVVANALVGLYRLGETDALNSMIAHCADKQHLFRAAMAWAMGVVEDARAVPSLLHLTLDRSYTVRQRATNSLATLGVRQPPHREEPYLPILSQSDKLRIFEP